MELGSFCLSRPATAGPCGDSSAGEQGSHEPQRVGSNPTLRTDLTLGELAERTSLGGRASDSAGPSIPASQGSRGRRM